MVRAEALRHQVGVDELVAGAAVDRLETDAEGAQAVLALLGEQPDHERGVDAAGQQHADLDVGHHPTLHRQPQRVEDGLLPLLRRPRGLGAVADVRR